MAKLAGQPFHHTHQSAHILPSITLKCEASVSSIQNSCPKWNANFSKGQYVGGRERYTFIISYGSLNSKIFHIKRV